MPFTLAVETLSFALVLFHGGLALFLGYASLGLDIVCLALAFVGLFLSPTRRGNKCNLLSLAPLDGLLGRHEHIE